MIANDKYNACNEETFFALSIYISLLYLTLYTHILMYGRHVSQPCSISSRTDFKFNDNHLITATPNFINKPCKS